MFLCLNPYFDLNNIFYTWRRKLGQNAFLFQIYGKEEDFILICKIFEYWINSLVYKNLNKSSRLAKILLPWSILSISCYQLCSHAPSLFPPLFILQRQFASIGPNVNQSVISPFVCGNIFQIQIIWRSQNTFDFLIIWLFFGGLLLVVHETI